MLGYIFGIIFIFIIGIGFDKKSTLLLQFVHYASVVVFAGQFLHNYFYLKKIKQKIPNSSKRSTRLEQRNVYQFISKKTLVIFGIFFTIAFIGILAAFLMHKISLQLFMTRFLAPLFVIVFLFSLVFFEARTSAVNFSKWTRYETILRASFTVVVFVATGFLIDLYIRLTGVLFEMPHFTYDSFYEYLLGGAALTAFMHFVLNMKLDIPDWYEKKSFQK